VFQHVDHSTVLQKLRNYGVPKFIIDWLASFLICWGAEVSVSDLGSKSPRFDPRAVPKRECILVYIYHY